LADQNLIDVSCLYSFFSYSINTSWAVHVAGHIKINLVSTSCSSNFSVAISWTETSGEICGSPYVGLPIFLWLQVTAAKWQKSRATDPFPHIPSARGRGHCSPFPSSLSPGSPSPPTSTRPFRFCRLCGHALAGFRRTPSRPTYPLNESLSSPSMAPGALPYLP